jgi:hypothetical protein
MSRGDNCRGFLLGRLPSNKQKAPEQVRGLVFDEALSAQTKKKSTANSPAATSKANPSPAAA